MKTTKQTIFFKTGFLILGLFLAIGVFAQVKYSNKNIVGLTVNGTSTMHDWEMKSAKGVCEATFTLNPAGAVTGMSALSFVTPVSDLKSEKESMDKNAYKALKSDKNANISFSSSSGTITTVDANNFTIKTTGKLTIAGAAHDAEIVGTCKVNADKSITVTGSKKISMKDFGMTPPTFMMGTIKTGNDVTLKFDVKISK
jgi:hypothetical protein